MLVKFYQVFNNSDLQLLELLASLLFCFVFNLKIQPFFFFLFINMQP